MPPVWFAMSSELYRQSNSCFSKINKTCRSPWPQNIFFWVLTAHHTLSVSCSGTVLVSSPDFQFLCYNSYAVIYTCVQWMELFQAQPSGELRLDHYKSSWTAGMCSAEHQQLQCNYFCMCMQYSESACSVGTRYVFFGTLVSIGNHD